MPPRSLEHDLQPATIVAQAMPKISRVLCDVAAQLAGDSLALSIVLRPEMHPCRSRTGPREGNRRRSDRVKVHARRLEDLRSRGFVHATRDSPGPQFRKDVLRNRCIALSARKLQHEICRPFDSPLTSTALNHVPIERLTVALENRQNVKQRPQTLFRKLVRNPRM